MSSVYLITGQMAIVLTNCSLSRKNLSLLRAKTESMLFRTKILSSNAGASSFRFTSSVRGFSAAERPLQQSCTYIPCAVSTKSGSFGTSMDFPHGGTWPSIAPWTKERSWKDSRHVLTTLNIWTISKSYPWYTLSDKGCLNFLRPYRPSYSP